jgi:tetratricopeptide (TPR) repeat protein
MKKILLLILTAQLSLTVFSQPELEKAVSNSVCKCIEKEKDVTQNNFLDCMEQAMEDNYILIMQGIAEQKDTSEDAAYKYGRRLADKIQPQLVFSCNAYFKMVENMRASTLKGFNNDSLRIELSGLEKTNETEKGESFFLKRGILYFKLKELDKALADFNTVIKNQQNSLQALLLKAWIHEMKQEYDEAILYYNKLSALTKKNEYNIFTAIAQRKKQMK